MADPFKRDCALFFSIVVSSLKVGYEYAVSKDHHDVPYDEGTRCKLNLYRQYLRSALPVFLSEGGPPVSRVNLFDFFAGPGQDVVGVPGSPLIAIEELARYRHLITKGGRNVTLYLNEKSERKYRELSQRVSKRTSHLPFSVRTSNEDFKAVFSRLYETMNDAANIVFLDQSGVKFVSNEMFVHIVAIAICDFLFFVASSYYWRFADNPDFNAIHIPKQELTARKFVDVHRAVTEHYRTLVPQTADYHLSHFSIKKGSGLYGLIYGTHHLRGLSKFLTVAWNEDPERGEANFDIDSDRLTPLTPHLFAEMDQPSKLKEFAHELENLIVDGRFDTDSQIVEYALCSGFLPKHARPVVKRLLRERRIVTDHGRALRISVASLSEPRSFAISELET